MKKDIELLNKFAELLECLSKAKITFKKKEDVIEINTILKEIKKLRDENR